MRFKYIFPLVFVLVITIPLIAFLFISKTESKETFVAISGVSSFLFGLLGANTIRERQTRLDKIVQNAATERGELVFIAEILAVYPQKEQAKVIHKIDEYLMAQLDLETHYFNLTDKQYEEMTKVVIDLPIETEKQKKLYDRLMMALEKIEGTREYSATLFEDRITKSEWAVLFFLTLLIYTSLLFANSGGYVALIVIGCLAAVISYLLVVAIKLDKMHWKVDEKIFEPYQQTFQSMGLLRYYPRTVLDKGVIYHLKELPKGTEYRVGETPNYPDISERKITVEIV